jgi:very-short-patch-repair endonuclease
MFTEKGIEAYKHYIHTQPRSSLEIKFRDELKKANIEFKEQVPFRGMFIDFVIKDKIAVEVDGSFWHNKPENKARDIKKDKLLLENGFKVFRFTDKEINTDVKSCVDKVLEWKK